VCRPPALASKAATAHGVCLLLIRRASRAARRMHYYPTNPQLPAPAQEEPHGTHQ